MLNYLFAQIELNFVSKKCCQKPMTKIERQMKERKLTESAKWQSVLLSASK